MPTPEIYKQAKIERLWIGRLRELGADVFQNIIRRMLQGDALREIAFYCHRVNPQYAPETYRKWLRALENWADGPIAKYREEDHAQKTIDEFNKQKAKPNSLAAKLDIDPPSYEVMRRLHRNVNKETRKLNAGSVLQYLWFAAQKRLDEMMDLEERLGGPTSHGQKSLEVANKIAANFIRYELGASKLKRGEDEAIDITELDPISAKIFQVKRCG